MSFNSNSEYDYDGTSLKKAKLGLDDYNEILTKLKDKKVCLFLGAGFSKAWDNNYPLSDEIFSISDSEAAKYSQEYGFFSLFEDVNLKWGAESLGQSERANIFKSFKYTMDVYRRYPSLLPAHLDRITLDLYEKQLKNFIKNKFIEKTPKSDRTINTTNKISQDKKNIINFFKVLSQCSSLDIITTNYDIVIDKVLKKSSPEKTILRGFPVHIDNKLQCPKKGGIGLYKLNGGFEVIENGNSFSIDYSSITNKTTTPNIILPSNEQDYSDKYFKNAFIKSSNQLRNADILLFIGYSFPKEDFIIQFLLKTFLDSHNNEKETIIISRSEDSAINYHKKACEIFVELNENSGLYYFKGSFLELCKQL